MLYYKGKIKVLGASMKICRIISTILCAVCIAALPLVGIFIGFDFIVIPLFGAGLFFTLMLFFRKKHIEQEERTNPTPPTGDYLNPISEEVDEKQSN